MSKSKGYIKIATIGGSPVLVHWSFPAGGLLVSIYGHMDPRLWVYYCLTYTILILAHEGGHFIAARFFRLKVFAVEIAGTGGLCRIERPQRISHCALVYSAGLIAQIIVFLLTQLRLQVFGAPESAFEQAVVNTFTFVNLFLFVTNLIPHLGERGLQSDGYVLWKLWLHVYKGHPHPCPPLIATPADQTPVFPPDTRLISKPGFKPAGFLHGIEILNDNTTPMEFVVSTLTRHLELSREEAVVKMLDIHNTGGVLIALPTVEKAQSIADAITTDARSAGHSFVCRYAGAQQSVRSDGTDIGRSVD